MSDKWNTGSISDLLRRIETAERERDEVQAVLRSVEWAKPLVTSIHNAGSYCPFYSASKMHGHTQHCRIGKALAALKERS